MQRPRRRRLFAALDLTDPLRDLLAGLGARLAAQTGGRAVPSENLHLTLEFLGAVDEDRVPGLVEAVRALPPGPPGPVRLRRLQARPSPHRPRLVAAVLDDLEGGVRARRDQVRAAVAAALGRPPADEAFWPHVTLVRYSRPGRLSGFPDDEPGWERTFAVGRAALYDSVTIPGGPPRYEALARAQSGP